MDYVDSPMVGVTVWVSRDRQRVSVCSAAMNATAWPVALVGEAIDTVCKCLAAWQEQQAADYEKWVQKLDLDKQRAQWYLDSWRK
jgi:hypothetical protein